MTILQHVLRCYGVYVTAFFLPLTAGINRGTQPEENAHALSYMYRVRIRYTLTDWGLARPRAARALYLLHIYGCES